MQPFGKIAIAALCGIVFASCVSADEGKGTREHSNTPLRLLNKRRLRIPFTATNDSGLIRLYVSTDRGETWRIGAEQPSHGTELLFEGTEDGEHWFALATDAQKVDPKDLRVQQKVLIDSVGPKIDLQASADTRGTLTGSLKLTDLNKVTSLRVLYATDVHREWRTIANESISAEGKFQVTIREDWRKLSVHITATDSLGHVSVQAKTIQRPRVASSASPRTGFATHESRDNRPDFEARFADGPNHPGTLFLAQQNATAPKPATSSASQLPPGGRPATVTPDGIEFVPAPKPVEEVTEYGVLPAPTNSAPDPDTPLEARAKEESPPPSPSETQPQSKSRTLSEALRPMRDQPSRREPGESTPAPRSTPSIETEQRYRAERAELESRIKQEKFDLAQQLRDLPVRHSNSNRFSLDYELEAVGATGVEAVELYGSLDGGKTWKRWGVDPDGRSPFDIETKGEGVFGFRVVVLGNNGLASPRPLDGDPPDIMILVDQTKPRVKITSARYGEGDRTGSLEIRYDCEDENLRTRPVAIAFSESLQGPWTTIVSGLRNDGLYVWPAGPKIPRQIYLRIDAIDQAGNRGKYLLDQPIETQGLAPRAKILGLRTQ